MVEVKELRIGNFILHDDKICEVCAIYSNGMMDISTIDSYIVKERNNILIEPIPITEELLLKCGFTKEYYGFSCDIVELSYGRFLCNDDTDKDNLFLSINNAEYTISGVSLKYLHQLQNMYFYLTGNELEVKL